MVRATALPEVVDVPVHDSVFEAAFLSEPMELDQQALAQVPRRDSDRMERLDDGEHPVERSLVHSRVLRHLLGRCLQESDVVDVPN